jgi:transcriptional regulator with XRE-family HTH domain
VNVKIHFSPYWPFPRLGDFHCGGTHGEEAEEGEIERPEVIRQFAERLRETRSSVGLTQRELADKAHLSEGKVARLEAADTSPGLDLLFRLAVALEVPLADLLPAATPPAPLDALRQRARSLCDEVVSTGDRATLLMLTALLARLTGR